MQLYAIDAQGNLVAASQAKKQQNYVCLECGQRVRVRSGLHRQSHYYHLQFNRTCRQHGKGMVHLLLQNKLKAQLPEGGVELEHRFPAISRIADVVWFDQRIVFEIQCAPITAEEVDLRNQSYASIGYQVVWVFHDSRYNKFRLTAAEHRLIEWPHYFTDMNAKGEGIIYDQMAHFERGLRIHRLPYLTVDLASPVCHAERIIQQLPKPILERAKKWPLSFKGDCVDRFAQMTMRENPTKDECDILLIKAADEWIQKYHSPSRERVWQRFNWLWQRWIAVPYRSLLNLLIERACR